MSRDGGVYRSSRFPGNTGHEREIDFPHRARGKLLRQVAVRRIVLGHDKASARFLVEAMDDARAFPPADAREISAMGQERVDQGVLLMARSRMHHQTSRLVQDEKVVVFE